MAPRQLWRSTSRRLCVSPDLDHSWLGTHHEINFADPNDSLHGSNDGFVSLNDLTEQIDAGESPTDDDTIGFYTRPTCRTTMAWPRPLRLTTAISPRLPPRRYPIDCTCWQQLPSVTWSPRSVKRFHPLGGYQPINGTIFDLLDNNSVSWGEYFETGGPTELGIPYGALVHTSDPPHFQTLDNFMSQASSGDLPSVAFVDFSLQNSEHPPFDIQGRSENGGRA